MPTTILLSPLDDRAREYVVEQYYCAPPDPIERGQPFVMVRSDGFVWDVPAPSSGTLATILAAPGTTITVGTPLVEIEDREQGSEDQRQPVESSSQTEARLRATPTARTIAQAHAIDLSQVSGTGYGGAIRRADVWQAIGNRASRSGDQRTIGAFGTKDQIADPPAASALVTPEPTKPQPDGITHHPPSTIPAAFTAIEVDLTAAFAFLNQNRTRLARRGIQLTITSCVAAATVAALAEHRLLNSAWGDDGIILRSRVHLLVEQAMHTTIRSHIISDATDLNLFGLARKITQGSHGSGDDVQPTFAISEQADAWWGDHYLNGTFAAHLSIGAVRKQPCIIETTSGDLIEVRPTALLILSYDARILNQTEADIFLSAIKRQLERLGRL